MQVLFFTIIPWEQVFLRMRKLVRCISQVLQQWVAELNWGSGCRCPSNSMHSTVSFYVVVCGGVGSSHVYRCVFIMSCACVCVWDKVCHWPGTSPNCPVNLGLPVCLPSHHCLNCSRTLPCLTFCVGYGDPNSGSHTWKKSTLPTISPACHFLLN